MRAALRNGRILTPSSLRAAHARRKQLAHEIAKIQAQLTDPKRILRYPSTSNFDTWQESARHALKLFHNEAAQIDEWLWKNTTPEALLSEALDILLVLRGETDLEKHELDFIDRLKHYFANPRRTHAQDREDGAEPRSGPGLRSQ
ncbi:MAG: hypothetical protein UY96_C0003G0058 [Parcubacteria group bacterium GW2011_GWB1_56_8]|nr:MAG: hypothetical protein UY96_C0003G0058 [Parcubacteria group bacterium GW2011_GWB1_56_8]